MKFRKTPLLAKLAALMLGFPALGHAVDDYCVDCAPLIPYSSTSPFDQSDSVTSTAPAMDFASPYSGGLGASSDVAIMPGYIENAVPMNLFRFRFDALFDNETPDRAEFFYAQYGGNGGKAPGPLAVGKADAQEYSLYLELAPSDVFSVFVELPFRAIQPGGPTNVQGPIGGPLSNDDQAGIGDLNFGFKYALIREPDSVFTFQMRVYTPTGDAGDGLGTDHVTLEPGLLYQANLTDRLLLFAELKDWIPINGSSFDGRDFSGNVLRYGIGTGYTVYDNNCVTVTPLVEFVGWSVLGGLVSGVDGADQLIVQEANTTIVNVKAGVRVNIARNEHSTHTIYAGFGQALTDDAWYDNILRVDWGIIF